MILLELFQSSFLSSILFRYPHLLAPLWTKVKLYSKKDEPLNTPVTLWHSLTLKFSIGSITVVPVLPWHKSQLRTLDA